MGICYNTIFLNIIMYLKYIMVFSFIITLIYTLFKKKNIYAKKIRNILLILLVIFYSLMLMINLLNFKIKYCFNNSNFYKLYYTSKLYDTYKSNNNYYSYDVYSQKIKPNEEKNINSKDLSLKIYNINYYPLSDINFTLNESTNSFNMKNSGVEIATLSTIISSLNYTRDISPVDIIKSLKYSEKIDYNNFDMDTMLNILFDEYDFRYMEINSEQIDDALNRGGLILTKVHGNENGTIFTCSDSYIIIYNEDNEFNYYIINVNDKNYDTICNENTIGFGNVVKANQNNNNYSFNDIIENSERFYVLWR